MIFDSYEITIFVITIITLLLLQTQTIMIAHRTLCFKRKVSCLIAPFLSILFLLTSCEADDVGNYYTFTGQTIGQYLEEDTDEMGFVEFHKLLTETQVLGLLNAYGEYTCFIPTDEAMYQMYKDKGVTSFEELKENLRPDELLKMAYDHVIKDAALKDANFNEGIILNKTMSDRFVSLTSEKLATEGYYYVNNKSAIINLNVECHNGIVHVIDAAIQPTENNLAEAIEMNGRYTVFTAAMKECMLDLLITEYEDETYDPEQYESLLSDKPSSNNGDAVLPEKRKYGYTMFVLSDSLLEKKYSIAGENALDQLKALAKEVYDPVYPADASITDPTDRRNSLNRFISYHMLDRLVTKRLLIDVYTDQNRNRNHIPSEQMHEYLETMLENTLMSISYLSSQRSNLINYNQFTDQHVSLLATDGQAVNGVYHELDSYIAYDRAYQQAIASKRLRLNVASFFPELTNNGYRGNSTSYTSPSNHTILFPSGYLERMSYRDYTKVMYLTTNEDYCDYQGDEFFLVGTYEFDITTPPIPEGSYEVRFGYQPTGARGVAQLYWDNKPIGIPLDMTINASNPTL